MILPPGSNLSLANQTLEHSLSGPLTTNFLPRDMDSGLGLFPPEVQATLLQVANDLQLVSVSVRSLPTS